VCSSGETGSARCILFYLHKYRVIVGSSEQDLDLQSCEEDADGRPKVGAT
jgi:hypothetical protein